jgi:uncharacterized protein (DUF1800 family)
MLKRFSSFALLFVTLAAAGCTVSTSSSNNPPQIVVIVSPTGQSIRAGASQQFSAGVTGTANTGVTWAVNGTPSGSATLGTITAAGLYTAPAVLPTSNAISIQATSTADGVTQGSTGLTLLNPVPVVSAISPSTVGVGALTITVSGSRFVSGAQVMFGTTALTTTFVSASQLTATGTATAAQVGNVTVTVVNPDPGTIVSATSKIAQVTSTQAVTGQAAARFLEQATFGPTTQSINQLQQTGFVAFLNDQFLQPASTYPDPAPTVNTLTPTQQIFFTNALTGQDQLRQRVSFALSEIWVTSGNTIPPQGMAPYMRLLQQDAFVNYRQLMFDVTLSPAMGRYLDMVNNDKPDPVANTHANENYARELMQLFTLGTYLLNQDGSLKLDAQNNPQPTYAQTDIQSFARAYTGWTYPTQAGSMLQKHNPVNWLGPMEALDSNHDVAAKTLLRGTILPAGQTSLQDLNGALDNLFNHPNLPPFVSKQLIQHLVTSNPSAAYIKRVADVFASGTYNGFGNGQRGDLQAVIAAILLDPEARRGDSPATTNAGDGHLAEPILYITAILRAFNATSDGLQPVNFASSLSEGPLRSPSVFNFFPPNFEIPGTALLGPEFNLQTTATAFVKINFVNSFVFGSLGAGTTVDFSSYNSMAANPGQLVDALNALLLHGSMSSSMRGGILTAINAVPVGSTQAAQQVKTAIYLILSSSQYQVQH